MTPPAEIVAVAASKPWSCAECSIEFVRGEFLTMADAGPLCLDCADLGHLDFLPRGDTALTRRARKVIKLSAVVVQGSRTRKQYERQGILAEAEAIALAEKRCASVDARELVRGDIDRVLHAWEATMS